MNKFTPRPHQISAINAIVKELKTHDRTTTVMACGSGKTLVALWVAEKLNAKNILVLLPSLALIAQAFNEWKKHSKWLDFNVLCICSDKTVTQNDAIKINPNELDFPVTTDTKIVKQFLNKRGFKIVFSTYQSCDLIPNDFKFDLGVFDEAHKTAGHETKLFSYALRDENVNISKRLFMTATPKHFDVNKRNKLGENLAIFSMDDQAVYGKVCYKLSFSDAVNQDIICGYKIIISTLTLAEVNRALINSSNVYIKNKLIEAKNIANSLALINAVKDNDIKKVFAFHKTIKDSRVFTSKSNRVVASGLRNHLTLHVSGDMNSNEREAIINDFETSPMAILSNAKCLTEGVDVPAVDMVAFMSPKKSQVDIIQAAGRAMRKYSDKKQGYILIPIFLEKQENFEEALNETQYKNVWDILQALQEYDEELFSIMSELRRSRVRKEKINYERFNKKIEIMGVGSGLRLTTLRNAVTTKIINKLTSSWDENFEKLLIFKEKYGHINVPQVHSIKDMYED
jgi:predicted helicase